ncbi:MAG TPA: thioesterase family protein [Solirubrobacteraceae bacterium]|jgi:hypothetical protein|nr:thioesterase family protein [Solirubrobacteraceae bacterium]
MTEQGSGVDSSQVSAAFSQVSCVSNRGGGIFDAEVSAEWTIAGRPNGGYLLALMGRAAGTLVGSGDVVAASAHYLHSPDPGPVEIEGELLRRGRSTSQVRVRLSQGDRACVEALVSTSELGPSVAPLWDGGVPDVEPVPYDKCVRLEPVASDGFRVPMLDHVDMRLEPKSNGMIRGTPSGRGELRGWLELLGEEGFDPVSLLYAADAFPPTTFDTDFSALVSTLELTVYVRAIPAPGPLRVVSRARLIDPQWVDESCDVCDQTGRLVARATQLAKVWFG